MKRIFLILFIGILFIQSNVQATYNGYVKVGSSIKFQNVSSTNKNDFLPYLDIFTIDDRPTGIVSRGRLQYNYNKEDKNDFNQYTIQNLYFYLDRYNEDRQKNWFLYIGDRTSLHSPISVWSSKIRGIQGGMILNETKSIFDKSYASAYVGYSKAKKKGFESGTLNTPSYNGQFLQGSYGGNLSLNINKFNIDTVYNVYKDDEKSLKTNEIYQAKTVENDLFSTKLGYFALKNKVYISYANSKYNSDTSATNKKILKGNAYYIESENYIEQHHLLGQFYFIDSRFFSQGATGLQNDVLKILVGDDWSMSDNSILSVSGSYKRNNTDFDPIQEVLTDNELELKAENVFNFQNEIILGLRTRIGSSKSRAEVNETKTDWKLYEAGFDATKIFPLGNYFDNFKVTLTSTYNKKLDNSIISSVKNGWQEYIETGFITLFDVILWDNAFSIFYYRLNNQNGDNQNIINLTEKWGYLIIPDQWKFIVSVDYQVDALNQKQNYNRYSVGLGSEIYFTFRQTLIIDTSYGKYNSKTATPSSSEFLFKLEYNYLI